jgi:hypothetical protein
MSQVGTGDARWEKCARLLLLNSLLDIDEMKTTLELILKNIINNIEDKKYRSIKSSNKVVNRKILSKNGGLEFLLAVGFQIQNDETGAKILVLPTQDDNIHEISLIQVALDWLCCTAASCVAIGQQRQKLVYDENKSTVCCDCIIQIRLPTGTIVSGGFMSGDTLRDVLHFASCYFQTNRCTIRFLLKSC